MALRSSSWVQAPFIFIFLSFSLVFFTSADAQLVNGQFFTNGLAIINSPQAQTPFRANSNIPISIEVSGNGQIPLGAALPGSAEPTRFELLEIYLVSSSTNINVTGTSGTSLLTDESGSVRHFDFIVPGCVPSGSYNLTFYETSVFNNEPVFTITPIPVNIENNDGTEGACATNTLESQPQADLALDESPFIPGNQGPIPNSSSSSSVIPPTAAIPTPTAVVTTRMVTSVLTTQPASETELLTTTVTSEVVTTLVNNGNLGFIPVNSSWQLEISKAMLLANFLIFSVLLS